MTAAKLSQAPDKLGSAGLKRLFWALFFLSGAASLTYQVAWQRVLTQVIGIDAYSVALIVSIFMLGFGLGGLLGAILVRRVRNLVVIYGAAELMLALFGFFSVDLIRLLSVWLVPLTPGLGVEFVANFALLSLPTILMGLTLPLMAHFVRTFYPPGTALGTIYSANIVGAAVGTLLAGFVLIGTVGLIDTCRWTGALNVMIALVLFTVIRDRAEISEAEPMGALSVRHFHLWLFLGIAFVVGFIALGYEIVFFRLFTTYFGMVSYVFPLLLFSYLCCMAAGSRIFGRLSDRYSAANIAIVISIAVPATTLIILYTPSLMLALHLNQGALVLSEVASHAIVVEMLRILVMSVVLMVPVAFISGLFPVLVRVLAQDSQVLGNSTGLVYFVQTTGNAAGALGAGLLLLPGVGTIDTLRLFGIVLIVLPALLWILENRERKARPPKRFFVGAVAATVAVLLFPGWYYHTIHDRYDAFRFNETRPLAPDIVIENALGVTFAYHTPVGYWVNVGRTRSTPIFTHPNAWEIWPLEFIPPLVPRAKRALIIGIGPGMHLPVLRRLYPGVKIDVAEINPALIRLLREHSGGGVVEGLKKSNVYLTDGRRFVLTHEKNRYDIIQVGLNHATMSGSGNLFTEEFFRTLKGMLNPGGVLTIQAFTSAVKAALHDFENVAVVSPGGLQGRLVAKSLGAGGSGPGEAQMIAWNHTGQALFRERLMAGKANDPSVIFVDPTRPPPSQRPNWSQGCLLFRHELTELLAPVRAATDDLPVTEYFLTQRQAVRGVEPGRDARYFGCPKGSVALRTLHWPSP